MVYQTWCVGFSITAIFHKYLCNYNWWHKLQIYYHLSLELGFSFLNCDKCKYSNRYEWLPQGSVSCISSAFKCQAAIVNAFFWFNKYRLHVHMLFIDVPWQFLASTKFVADVLSNIGVFTTPKKDASFCLYRATPREVFSALSWRYPAPFRLQAATHASTVMILNCDHVCYQEMPHTTTLTCSVYLLSIMKWMNVFQCVFSGLMGFSFFVYFSVPAVFVDTPLKESTSFKGLFCSAVLLRILPTANVPVNGAAYHCDR